MDLFTGQLLANRMYIEKFIPVNCSLANHIFCATVKQFVGSTSPCVNRGCATRKYICTLKGHGGRNKSLPQ